MGEKVPEFFQEVVSEATGTSTEFQDIDRVVRIEHWVPVPQEAEDDFGIGISNEGITRDVVRNGALIPGVDTLLGKEMTLKLPEKGLGKGLIRFQDRARGRSWRHNGLHPASSIQQHIYIFHIYLEVESVIPVLI